MSEEIETKEEQKEEPKADPDPAWVADLDTYPLREPSDDPRWAVRTVWIWTAVALASLVFILTLLVLGFFYD